MIKKLAIYLGSILIGLVIGVGSALYMAGLWPGMKPLDFGDVAIDLWRSDFALGSEAADPYTRARVARHGLLALAKSGFSRCCFSAARGSTRGGGSAAPR